MKIVKPVLLSLFFLNIFILSTNFSQRSLIAKEKPGCSGIEECGQDGEWNNNCTRIEKAPYIASAPEGEIITFVFIEASKDCYTDTNNGCYSIEGVGTATASAVKIGENSPTCKEITYVEFVDFLQPSPSPSPIITPSPSPGQQPSPSPGQTPLPSPNKDQPNSDNNTNTSNNHTDQENNQSTSQAEKQGQVLNVDRLAKTGSFIKNSINTLQFLGFALTTIGLSAYEKKN